MVDDPELGIVANPDAVTRARHLFRYRWARDVVTKHGEHGTVLDCACGSGYGTEILGSVRPTIGVDPDADALAYAEKHHSLSNVSYIQASCQTIWSLVGMTYSVVSIETLEHLSKWDGREWIARTAYCLPPTGLFVLACPIGNGGPNPANPFHLHEPTASELRTVLGGAFHEVEVDVRGYKSTSGPAKQAFAICRRPK
jgi:2-polyprenyl-3-methyl-5-hydroxy-6-metoxy-1,4-benzoquinol methylase